MNELKVFTNDKFGTIRTVELEGTAYFVGKDLAEILGYSNINKAIQVHVDEEDKKILNFKGFSHFVTNLVTANRIGRLSNANGLKDKAYGEWYKEPLTNGKEVESFRYNEKGVNKLRELLKD